jgi:hypothetical protein
MIHPAIRRILTFALLLAGVVIAFLVTGAPGRAQTISIAYDEGSAQAR